MLSIKNLSKSFPQRGKVLDNLVLDIEQGDSIAIMGPSGSGKTTLLNIAGLLDRPDSGSIHFEGADISSYGDEEAAMYRNRNIGFVFQDHMLLPHLTVLENISLPLLAAGFGKKELAEKEGKVKELMVQSGISELAGKYPFRISGGEAQRAALIRALANSPSVLLADEPTGSLDSGNAEMLGDLLKSINEKNGVTILLVTHSESLAKKMNKVFRLEAGKLVQA